MPQLTHGFPGMCFAVLTTTFVRLFNLLFLTFRIVQQKMEMYHHAYLDKYSCL